mgnify:CR=1 FL=1
MVPCVNQHQGQGQGQSRNLSQRFGTKIQNLNVKSVTRYNTEFFRFGLNAYSWVEGPQ